MLSSTRIRFLAQRPGALGPSNRLSYPAICQMRKFFAHSRPIVASLYAPTSLSRIESFRSSCSVFQTCGISSSALSALAAARRQPSQWDAVADPDGPKCHCGKPATKQIVRNGQQHNIGREFFACSHPRGHPDNCDYFAWADGSIAHGVEAWKRWGQEHGATEDEWKEALKQHWAQKPEDQIPESVKKFLAKEKGNGGDS